MKKSLRNILILFLCMGVVTIVVFIIKNSLEPVAVSDGRSKLVTQWIKQFLSGFMDTKSITNSMVRTVAHFSEYLLYGIVISIVYACFNKSYVQNFCNCNLIGVYTGLVDEKLQGLSDRSPEVDDVIMDASGFLVGSLLILVILVIIRQIKTYRRIRLSNDN